MQRSDYISEDQELNKINELYAGLKSVCNNYINDYYIVKNAHQAWALSFKQTIENLQREISNDISGDNSHIYRHQPELKIMVYLLCLAALVHQLKHSLGFDKSEKFLKHLNKYIEQYKLSPFMEETMKIMPESLANKVKYVVDSSRVYHVPDHKFIHELFLSFLTTPTSENPSFMDSHEKQSLMESINQIMGVQGPAPTVSTSSHAMFHQPELQDPGQEKKPVVEEPRELCCPISLTLMEDPVVVFPSGNTYDRSTFNGLKTNSITKCKIDPFTKEDITAHAPNKALRTIIEKWLKENPEWRNANPGYKFNENPYQKKM